MTDRAAIAPPSVLYICHNHPRTRPGGAEGYAHELFRAMRDDGRYRPTFLAKGGPPLGKSGQVHGSTPIAPVDGATDEYLLYTDGYVFDWFRGSLTDTDFSAVHLRKVLEALQPDVVHVQHLQFIGYDLVRVVRDVLPDCVIVYTLHEFTPICHQRGQMVRTGDEVELCEESSPRACHECFPEHSPQDFFLRRAHIQAHFAHVDHFLAPSRFVRDRYVAWGIEPARISYEDNGRIWADLPAPDGDDRTHRDRFAFFGQINPFKGLDVALEAFESLASSQRRAGAPSPHLTVHGANLDLQDGAYRERIRDLLDRTSGSVTFAGPYVPEDLPRLMAGVDWVVVPSIWWENAPLVIQEAFRHRKPVICSDIGGMAEKVTDGVDGLHFRARDPLALAAVVDRAATEDGLWDRLVCGIREPYPMADHVDRLVELYSRLAARAVAPRPGAVTVDLRTRRPGQLVGEAS